MSRTMNTMREQAMWILGKSMPAGVRDSRYAKALGYHCTLNLILCTFVSPLSHQQLLLLSMVRPSVISKYLGVWQCVGVPSRQNQTKLNEAEEKRISNRK